MDFSKAADRRGTNSLKWSKKEIGSIAANPEAEPFWVADMDFMPEPHLREKGIKLASLGIYGYPVFPDLIDSVSYWLRARHSWEVPSGRIVFSQGLLHGIASSLSLFTSKGDKVIVSSPMYRPFREITEDLGRVLVSSPLGYDNGCFFLDRERFSKDARGVKAIIFCTPQNPSGIVFSEDDILFVLSIAERENAVVIADEIHADLVHPSAVHIPTGLAAERTKADVITFFAPSKTFNVAGEHCSFAVFSDPQMEKEFRAYESSLRLSSPGFVIGTFAQTLYKEGLEYNRELCAYLEKNAALVRRLLKESDTGLIMANGDASYVTFIDCSSIFEAVQKEALENPGKYQSADHGGVLSHFFGVNASVAVNDGTWFGEGWERFIRFNYGTSAERVESAIKRMTEAAKHLTTQGLM